MNTITLETTLPVLDALTAETCKRGTKAHIEKRALERLIVDHNRMVTVLRSHGIQVEN
jgi:hypothetical protein